MTDYPPLSTELRAEIDGLSDDLDAHLTGKPRRSVDTFEPRRRALLAKHLGHEAPETITPVTCIGDSNTMFFAGSERLRFVRYRRSAFWKPHWINRGLDLLPCFRVFHVGPATAWKAGDAGSSTRSREKLEILLRKDVPKGSKVILSFGEIDCRIHMARAAKAGKPIEEITEATAAKFIRLPEWVSSLGFEPLVWGPPQIIPNNESVKETTFPFVGPWELRRDITYAYTERLRHHCADKGIAFTAVAGLYHRPEERPDKSYFHDGTHLSQRLMPLALAELEKVGFLPPELRPA
ncbi:sulfotransferase [Haloferula helveola]|uniref:Sulfotransferase n=2 Tax=Haloferula helveola TaxID=490095 RepID=A0ABM7RNK5_9BACT|nr:sulfotransferase [Haloferula helveola]